MLYKRLFKAGEGSDKDGKPAVVNMRQYEIYILLCAIFINLTSERNIDNRYYIFTVAIRRHKREIIGGEKEEKSTR